MDTIGSGRIPAVSTVGEQATQVSPETQHHLDKAVDVLVDEFGHHQPREKIQEIMDDSVSQLVGSAEVEDFLPALAHRFTGSG